MLPKRLSSPKIVYILSLVNGSNFPITHTMFAILKGSTKRDLFDGIPFNEIPMSWLVIVKSRSETVSTTCVLFWTCFAWKKIVALLEQLSGLMQYYLWVLKNLNVSVAITCLHNFTPSTPRQSARAFLLFERSYLHSPKNIFQTFSSAKINYRNPPKNPSMFSVTC